MANREVVTGLGGIFFKARDPKALAAWYLEHLGVPVFPNTTYGTFKPDEQGRDGAGLPLETAWSTFPMDTKYFGENSGSLMINYRVRDLDAMLAQLRAAGVWVSDRIDDSDFGKFSWAADPEGNQFELWQPKPE